MPARPAGTSAYALSDDHRPATSGGPATSVAAPAPSASGPSGASTSTVRSSASMPSARSASATIPRTRSTAATSPGAASGGRTATSAVTSRSPSSTSATAAGSALSSTTNPVPGPEPRPSASAAMPAPAVLSSTIRCSPATRNRSPSAATAPTMGRAARAAPVHPGNAGSGHSPSPPAASRPATEPPTRSLTTPVGGSDGCGLISAGGVELALHRLLQLRPGLLELVDALVLQRQEDVGEVDALGGQRVEDLLGLRGVAGDPVALDLAVVGEGHQGLLRHRVDGVGDHQLGHVERVGVVGVLDPGGGPQRPLRRGALGGQRLPARPGEDLLVRGVGEPRVRDRGLAAQRQRLVGADLLQPLVDLGVDPGDEEAGHRGDRGQLLAVG